MKISPWYGATVSIFIIGILSAGCVSPSLENITTPGPAGPTLIQPTALIPEQSPTGPSPPGQTSPDKSGFSPARQKLDTRLLQLLDPSMIPAAGNTLAEIKASMQQQGQLVPAADAYGRFGIARQSDRAVGDQVYVSIQLTEKTPVQTIEPYVTQVTDSDNALHLAFAWVDVNDLDRLVSLDGVRGIRIVLPAVHS